MSEMISGASYGKSTMQAYLTIGGKPQVLPVDAVIICAGQGRCANCGAGLEAAGKKVHLIRRRRRCRRTGCKRAINQGLASGCGDLIRMVTGRRHAGAATQLIPRGRQPQLFIVGQGLCFIFQ